MKFVSDFEDIAASHAIAQKYDYVICGHIHQPQHRVIENESGSVTYLNSGDWIENLTALEYQQGKWSIYQHALNKKAVNIINSHYADNNEVQMSYNAEVCLTLNTI